MNFSAKCILGMLLFSGLHLLSYGNDTIKASSLDPVKPNCNPEAKHLTAGRGFQGIPGLEVTPGGRLWATWYTGGVTECSENFAVLVTSSDNGKTWSEPVAVIDPPGDIRAFDPALWMDPDGRLWWFWAQSHSKTITSASGALSYELTDGRAGVWGVYTDNPEAEKPVFSEPKRIANGVMMNKPTVLSNGEWTFPTAVWAFCPPYLPELAKERFSNITISQDKGKTFTLRGSADIPQRCYDEHMIVELKNHRLWMLVRTKYGIGQSFSDDMGKTWSKGEDSGLQGPNSRFFIRRLSSGNLLLVNHADISHEKSLELFKKNQTGRNRSHLTAFISDDDGKTWKGGLLLDERIAVSYPDGAQDKNGVIRIIYDRERYKEGEILMATFTEEDVLARKQVSKEFKLKQLVNKTGGVKKKMKESKNMYNLSGINFAYQPSLIFKSDNEWRYGREPVIRRMPDSTLVCMIYSGGDREPAPDNKAIIVKSTDDGATWTKPEILSADQSRAVWGTEIFTETDTPFAIVHTFLADANYREIRAQMMFTSDSGKTWSKPSSIKGTPPNYSCRQGHVLSDSSWIFPVYWLETYPDSHKKEWNAGWMFRCGMIRSTDKGKTFSLSGYIYWDQPGLNSWEPDIIELENGHLLMLFRCDGTNVLMRSESFDYGKTWTKAVKSDIPNPGTKFSLQKIDGQIVLINNVSEKSGWNQRRRIEIWTSSDNTKTWGKKTFIAEIDKDAEALKLKAWGHDRVICYPHLYADFAKRTLYIAMDSISEHYMIKVPFEDVLIK